MDEHASFGAWMARRRKTLDLTQAELAERVGCALGTIRKIETDERRPSKQIAARLADQLQLASEELRGIPQPRAPRSGWIGWALPAQLVPPSPVAAFATPRDGHLPLHRHRRQHPAVGARTRRRWGRWWRGTRRSCRQAITAADGVVFQAGGRCALCRLCERARRADRRVGRPAGAPGRGLGR